MSTTHADDDRYLTIHELAAYSHLSERTIVRLLHADQAPIPHYKIAHRVLVRRSEFDDWVARHGTPENVARARTLDAKVADAVNKFRRGSK